MAIEMVAGKRKQVTNLGYLVRKLGKRGIYATSVNVQPSADPHWDGVMTVFYNNGDMHQSHWASLSLMEGWIITRRNLRGVPVTQETLELI